MARKSAPYRPAPVTVGPLAARFVRGPHKDDATLPENERRWYFRAWRGEEDLGTIGWIVPSDVARVVAERYTVTGDDMLPLAATSGTMAALLDAYLASVEARGDIAVNTKKGARRTVAKAREVIGHVAVRAWDDGALVAYQNTRLSGGRATGTVSQEVKTIRAAWAWGAGSMAPRRRIKKPAIEHRPVRDRHTPADQDIDAVLMHIPSDHWAWLCTRILEQIGARMHEVGLLTPACIDHRNRTLTIPKNTKTGTRTIKVRRALADDIARWCESRGVPLDADDQPLLGVAPGTLTASFGSFENGVLLEPINKAKVRRFTPHGLRRAAVRRFRRAGIPVGTAAAYFGHSIVVMLKLYDEVSEEDHEDALDLVDAHEIKVKAKRKAESPRLRLA